MITITDVQLAELKREATENRYGSLWIDDGWALPAEGVLALITHIETLQERLAAAEAALREINVIAGTELLVQGHMEAVAPGRKIVAITRRFDLWADAERNEKGTS